MNADKPNLQAEKTMRVAASIRNTGIMLAEERILVLYDVLDLMDGKYPTLEKQVNGEITKRKKKLNNLLIKTKPR